MFGVIAHPGRIGIAVASVVTLWVVGVTWWMVASLVRIGHWL